MKVNIKFAKCKDNAIIPTRVDGSAGLDIYACLPVDTIIIEPHESKLIPTGIKSSIDKDYFFMIEERGSTGSKGIKKNCGVIDADYRGEWFICLYNAGTKQIALSSLTSDNFSDEYLYYPVTKAIAQALILPVPDINIEECKEEELDSTTRGEGCLGSSNK